MTLSEFNKHFSYRHDFNSEDLDVLFQNFETIKFQNIPDAWIILLDNMLTRIQSTTQDRIVEVSQQFGLLIVSFAGKASKYALDIIGHFEKKLYLIDQDLHAKLQVTGTNLV